MLDMSEFKHLCINHSKRFAGKKKYIKRIDNFCSQGKRHMSKFNGVSKEHFRLFLKECKWHFNNPKPQAQLRMIEQWVKQHLTCVQSLLSFLASFV